MGVLVDADDHVAEHDAAGASHRAWSARRPAFSAGEPGDDVEDQRALAGRSAA